MFTIRAAMAAIVFGIGINGPSLAQDIPRIPVEFASGQDSAEMEGSITGDNPVDYLLSARAGQAMTVSLKPDGDALPYFNVMAPGSSGEAIFNGSMEGSDFYGTLPADGEYTVRVYQMGNDADTGVKASFSIAFRITAGPPAETAEDRCILALAEEANVSADKIKAVETTADGSGTTIALDLEGAEQPWRCNVDAAGSVVGLTYMGEG